MNHPIVHRLAFSLIVANLLAPLALRAEIRSKSKELVVMEPRDLSEQAQRPGNSFFLHSDDAGSTYLYIEQGGGSRLSIFDVSDPSQIKLVSSTPLTTSGTFDFVRPIGDRAELVRFRDGKSVAILDLRKAKRPILRTTSALVDPGPTEPLGETSFMAVDQSYSYVPAISRDYQVVDIAKPSNPILLTTVKQVKHSLVNSETGTTFLLGSDGLTVVRRISVENDYKTNLMQMQGN
jgi:hypothetical protein